MDSEAPYIVESDPPSGTVRFQGREVRIRFNERMDQRSFTDAVHISPLLSKPPVYDWSPDEVEILFEDELPANKTIVITLGSTLKDHRAGNAMKASWQLAFSTGDSLDRAMLKGVVLDAKPAGVSMFAYHLFDGRADTLDPTIHRPDYVVRTGEDGRFQFSYMRAGLYRVFAVRDNLNNQLYDVEADEFGIPERDVFAADSTVEPAPLRFTLHRQDTTAPYVQRVTASSSRLVQIGFSEDVTPFPPTDGMLIVKDSSRGEKIPALTVLRALKGKYTWDAYLQTPMVADKYLLELDSLRDASGNALRTRSMVFAGSANADTSRPVLLESFPKDGAVGAPKDSSFMLRFSRPVLPEISARLLDSTNLELPVVLHWPDMTRVEIGHPLLNENARYKFCLDLGTVKDAVTRRALADSTLCIGFSAGKEGAFGSVSGTFVTCEVKGVPHIRLRELREGGAVLQATADTSGSFTFPRVVEGKYGLDAFIDSDGNGRFSPGTARPLLAPEPSVRYRDTLRVRARWETGGVILKLE